MKLPACKRCIGIAICYVGRVRGGACCLKFHNALESKITVRAKRLVQQLKPKIKLCELTRYCPEKEGANNICHANFECLSQRFTSGV